MPPKELRTTLPTPGGYDQSLIAQAPEITRADRQEGYDINLVAHGHNTAHPPPARSPALQLQPQPTPGPLGSQTSLEKPPGVPPTTNGYSQQDNFTSKPIPWYKTTKGIAILIVAAVVLVGVVVGVAVGVTHKNNSAAGGINTAQVPAQTPPPAAPTAPTAASPTTAGGIQTANPGGQNGGGQNSSQSGNQNVNQSGSTPINTGIQPQ